MEVLPRPFKCTCIVKLLRRPVENPWLRYSLKKKAGKMEGGQGLYRTLRWSRDFPRVCGEPLKSIKYWGRLYQDP
jgi:hypothetical protein